MPAAMHAICATYSVYLGYLLNSAWRLQQQSTFVLAPAGSLHLKRFEAAGSGRAGQHLQSLEHVGRGVALDQSGCFRL